jgi:septum formation protein
MNEKIMALLLASKSSARRAMLDAAGVPFRSVDAEIDEEAVKKALRRDGIEPAQLALALAKAKALAVAPSEDLVLGSDQVLELDDGTMLDKPKSREDAAAQLLRLRGTTHKLHSSAAIADNGSIGWTATQTAELTMRDFSQEFLEAYLDAEYEAIQWGVGGYRIEGPGAQLFENIKGSHFAILGMPLLPLLEFLRERAIIAV